MQSPGGHSQLCLAVSLKASETVLLFIGVTPTVTMIQGTLHHDTLLTPDPPKEGNIQDIRWEKNGKRIIRSINGKTVTQQKEKYQVFENGTLKIKHAHRNDSGIYEVNVYNSDGRNMVTQTFDLKILGKSLFPKFLHLNVGAI